MPEHLKSIYNTDTKLKDLIGTNIHGDVMRRVRRGDFPAIMSNDTSSSADIWGFIRKMPSNAFWAFYNPRKVNVDDMGRLSEKAFRRFYRPAVAAVRWTAWLNPNLRNDGVKNLRAMDLDSFHYMEPILYYSDAITLKHLEPLFTDNKKLSKQLNAAGSTPSNNAPVEQGVFHALSGDISALKSFADKMHQGRLTKAEQDEYNRIIKSLHKQELDAVKKLKAMNEDINLALQEIDAIKIDTKDNALKRARVKAMREHFLRLQKQNLDVIKITKSTKDSLISLGKADNSTSLSFSDALKNITTNFERKLSLTHKTSNDLIDMAHARLHRKSRIRDDNGKITGETAASAEEYRRLKLGIDLLFVPETAQTLGLSTPKDKEHNAESYFSKIVEHGLKNCFDPEGNYIEIAKRGPHYGKDIAEFIVKLYALNKAEDALYAIKLLKMAEGKENYQMFPPGFRDFVTDQLAAHYGKDKQVITQNSHANLFIDRIHELASQDDHSPLIYGARDTSKRYLTKVKTYIYGRMYPASDSFVAVPLHMALVQEPLIKRRSAVVAYFTGGHIAPMAEATRKPRTGNILEQELGLHIKRTWWWTKKEQPETPEGEEPKRKNIISRTHDFYKRSPFWAKTPMRAGQMAALTTSALVLASGTALPLIAIVPLYAVGGASAMNYSLKAAKGLWRVPFINQGVKKTAKWTAIAAVTAASAYVIIPLLPAAGAMVMAAAIAYPTAAGVVASPFALLASIAVINGAASLMSKNKGNKNRTLSFGDFRMENDLTSDQIDVEDILNPLSQQQAPNPGKATSSQTDPEVIILDIKMSPEGADDPAQANNHQSGSNPDFDMDDFMDKFADKMAQRDQDFMDRMDEMFKQYKNSAGHTHADDDIEDAVFEDVTPDSAQDSDIDPDTDQPTA